MHARLAAALALLTPARGGRRPDAGAARRTLGDGTVRLSFAARAGVCGNGGHSITIVGDDEDDEWESDCTPGPVRVSLRVRGGRVADAHTYVGGRWRPPEAEDDRSRPGAGPAGGGRPARAGRAAAGGRRGAGHRRHAGRQRGRVAGAAPDRPPHRAAARDAAAGGLLAGPGGRRGGDARARLDRDGRRRRARGAEAGGVRPVAAAGGRGRAGADPDRAHRIRTPSSARRRSSGWARARIRGRIALFEEILR